MFGSSLENGLRRFGHFCDSARCSVSLFREFRIHSALIGVFFAVDRRNVRRIFIEIRSPNPIFLAVRVDPSDECVLTEDCKTTVKKNGKSRTVTKTVTK